MCLIRLGRPTEVDRRPPRYPGEPLHKRLAIVKDAPRSSFSSSSSDYSYAPPPVHPALAYGRRAGPGPFALPVSPAYGNPNGGILPPPPPPAFARPNVPLTGPGFVVGEEDAQGVRPVGPPMPFQGGQFPMQGQQGMMGQRPMGPQYPLPGNLRHRFPGREGLGIGGGNGFGNNGRFGPGQGDQWNGGQGRMDDYDDVGYAPEYPNQQSYGRYDR